MATKKIIVFLGSTREGRLGDKVARYVGSVLEKTGLSVKLFGKYLKIVCQKFHNESSI